MPSGTAHEATTSTWSPALSVPTSSWFPSPGTCTALCGPVIDARTPPAFCGANRLELTCSPANVVCVATRFASSEPFEIAPGTIEVRVTLIERSMCCLATSAPDVPSGMSFVATRTVTSLAPR